MRRSCIDRASPLNACILRACAEAADIWSIHRDAPPFVEQSTAQEILVTGIKVRCVHAAWVHAHGQSPSDAAWVQQEQGLTL
jgi:hypothetical protein